MKNKKTYFYFGCFGFLMIVFLLLLFAAPASAAGLVPCGTTANPRMCTVCDFFKLIQNIINFFLFVSVPLVTLAAIYIAFLFMFSGGSPKRIEDAKSKLWLVVWGIFWIFGSWLVLNTVLNIVAKQSVFPWPWNQINCSVSAPSTETPTPGYKSTMLPDTQAALSRLDNNPPLPAAEFGGGATGGGGAGGTWEEGVQTDTTGYVSYSADIEHAGLEQVEPSAPYSTAEPINPVVDPIVQQANIKGIDQNLVKAIIQAESSGNVNAIHVDKDGQASYGLMQVRPDTARRYDAALAGLTDTQVGERLKDPNYNTQIGTAYLQDLAAKYGSDLNSVIAAYNGGPGANKSSIDCPGSARWQCQWDNTAQTVPNTGYAVTRNYVTKVSNYYSQLSK